MSSEEAQRQSGKLREISHMADRFGCTPSQLAIAWSLRNEHVHSVLIGAVSPEQLYEHLQALQVRYAINSNAEVFQSDSALCFFCFIG